MGRNEEPLPPQSHMLGDGVQLDSEDTLESDPRADPLDSGYVTLNRPLGLDEYGTTLEEERAGESLDGRLAREQPDVLDGAEEAPDEVPDPRSGRLVAPDEGIHHDVETDMVGRDVGIDGGAASAEEAAVHVREEEEPEERDLP